jgi:hypothetical protein
MTLLTGTETLPHVPLPTPSLEPLALGIPVLDQHAPLLPGQVHLLEAQGPWESVRCQLVLEAYRRGLPVYQVIAGDRIDPYSLSRAARRVGLEAEDVLGHSLLARAFTAHQLSSLIHQGLPRYIAGPSLVLLTDPMDLYAGGEVDPAEGRILARNALRRFAAIIAKRGAYGVVVTRPFPRRGAGEELLALGGPHVRLKEGKEGLVCDLMHERRRLVQWTVWPQARLDDYGMVVFPVEAGETDPLVFQGASAASQGRATKYIIAGHK